MEISVKDEYSEASNSYHTRQQEKSSIRDSEDCKQLIWDEPVGNSQKLCSMKVRLQLQLPNVDSLLRFNWTDKFGDEFYGGENITRSTVYWEVILTDDVNPDTKYKQDYAKSLLTKEDFANHVSGEYYVDYATGGSELLSTDKQTHINYYDAFQTVKIEINVDENNTETKEDVFPFEFSNMMSSHSKENVNYNTLPLEASSQVKNEVILDGAPTAKKTKLKGSLNKNCKKKKKVSVNHTSETRDELTHTDEKVFACNICGYKCKSKSYLKRHIRTHSGDKPFACNFCDYKCRLKSYLKRHIKTHIGERPFACNICDYKCNRNDDLKRHIKKHTGDKPFACNICDYKFTQQCNLKQHIRTHTGVKPFTCIFCDYKCTSKSYLKRHIRTHNGEKPFACNICDYKCNRNDGLQRHLRTHSGDKPFACNICNYKSNQQSNLRQHIRTHTEVKPFTCNICDYKFRLKSHLKLHIRVHTGEKPFACNICDYKCNQSRDLKKHMRTHIGE